MSTAGRIQGLKEKIPDMTKALDMVKFLESKKSSDEDFTTNYELNDTLYAKAKITPSDKVLLWLGVSDAFSAEWSYGSGQSPAAEGKGEINRRIGKCDAGVYHQ